MAFMQPLAERYASGSLDLKGLKEERDKALERLPVVVRKRPAAADSAADKDSDNKKGFAKNDDLDSEMTSKSSSNKKCKTTNIKGKVSNVAKTDTVKGKEQQAAAVHGLHPPLQDSFGMLTSWIGRECGAAGPAPFSGAL